MSSDRMQHVYELFLAVASLPAADRGAALRERCGDDEALFDQLVALLETGAADDERADVAPTSSTANAARTVLADDAADRRAARTPDHIGPYRIVHELGHGGMGLVYLGVREDERFKRRAAVKVLKRGMDTEEVLRRFELERQLLAALNHPNIARVYDAGETEEGLPYFAMEYVEGLRVDEYCDRHRLRITQRLELFRLICSAVHYAHQNLVVHRDLKPSNIIMTKDGVPKLLDFGIAKLINPDVSVMVGDPTAPEMRVMTPEYASPEQVLGDPITTASDVYSLGVLLYELVSGHRPYRLTSHGRAEIEHVVCDIDPAKPSTAVSQVEPGDTRYPPASAGTRSITPESVSKTREGRPDRLRRRLSGDVDTIVLKAMRKEPQRRYASAEQFAEDIRRHLEGLTVIARHDTIGYRFSKFVRRNRTGVAAAMLVLFTLIAGIAGTSWQAHVAGVQRDAAENARRSLYELTNKFLFEFHEAIQVLEGSLEARAMLVETSLAYLDGLAVEAGDDPEQKRTLATAYDRLGDIQGGIRSPSRGDREAALKSYRIALRMRHELLAASPDDRELQGEVVTSLTNIGDMLRRGVGDMAGALLMYREVLAIRETQVEATPQDEQSRRGLALALNAVGTALKGTGDTAGAREHYERSLAIRARLAKENPRDLGIQRDLTVLQLRMGGLLRNEGDLKGALEHFEAAVEIRERLAEAEPDSARFRRDLAWARYFAADTLLRLDRAEEADPQIDRFIEVIDRLAKGDRGDARAQSDLVILQQFVGVVRLGRDDPDGALVSFDDALATARSLAESAPGDAGYLALVADCHEGRADVFRLQGDHWAAVGGYRSALDIVTDLATRDESDAGRQEQQARLRLALGGELTELSELDEAETLLDAALAQYGGLSRSQPAAAAIQEGVAGAHHARARIMLLRESGPEAIREAEAALATARERTAEHLRTLAQAHLLAGNRAEAMKAFEEAIQLLAEAPDTEETQALRALLTSDLEGVRN